VDGNGDVLVAGFFTGTVDFGGGPLTSAGGADIFVVKYSATGGLLWSKRVGGTGSDKAPALAIDPVGNVVMAGSFQGTVDFGGGALTSAGGNDVFIAKYSGTSGAHVWSKRFGNTSNDAAYGVAVDSSSNVLVTGTFLGSVNFGGATFADTGGGTDLFVAKYSSTGAHVWSKSFGGSLLYGALAFEVAVDGADNVVITGAIMDDITFGGGALWATSNYDIAVAKFAASGTHLWSKRVGGAGADHGTAVAVDANNNVLVTGDFFQSVNFGGSTFTTSGGIDGFVVKFAP
jgi:hypothetical protein